MKLKTLDYGIIPVAKKDTFLCNEILTEVIDCKNNFYEIKQTLNGQIVALLVANA
jgi:hypothetical protein